MEGLLNSLDQVCVNYTDLDYLREECEDGRALGFTGKVTKLHYFVDVRGDSHHSSKLFILRK